MSSSAPLRKKPKLSNQIDELSIHPQLIQKLTHANLCSFKSILQFSVPELQKKVKISPSEAKNIIEVVSQRLLLNVCSSAYSLLKEKSPQEKFYPDLLKMYTENCDCFYTGTIIEICGESGCGKTQLCLHSSIQAQKPVKEGGLNSKVIYIHTEGDFPIKRFLQMASEFKKDNPQLQNLKLSDNIILKKVLNLLEMLHVLQKGVPDLMNRANKPKLVVIDSVAALLRCEYESPSSRTAMIQEFAHEIWKLANIHGMAVICVNQVSGFNKKLGEGAIASDVPSLGLLWSNILTTRIKVSRKPSQNKPTNRILDIIYSSYHPQLQVEFTVSEKGIEVCEG